MSLCSRLFSDFSITIDPRIQRSLMQSVNSVMQGAALSVTAIGRGNRNASTEKQTIKKADRLVGNQTLHKNKERYYQQVIKRFVTETHPPHLC